jgi:intracellular multiplication protein IcmL
VAQYEQQHAQQQEDVIKAFAVEDMSNYRDGFKNLMRLVIVQACLMVFFIGFDFWYISTKVPEDSYFAVSPGGTKRTLTGLPKPNANTEALSRWAASAVTEIMTFGFHDIDERLTNAQRLFSPKGWDSFSAALFRSRLLKNVMNQQQMMTAIPAKAPTVLAEGMVMAGEWGWVMEATIILTTRAGSAQSTSRAKVRLILVRMPTATNPMGIGIRTLIVY